MQSCRTQRYRANGEGTGEQSVGEWVTEGTGEQRCAECSEAGSAECRGVDREQINVHGVQDSGVHGVQMSNGFRDCSAQGCWGS